MIITSGWLAAPEKGTPTLDRMILSSANAEGSKVHDIDTQITALHVRTEKTMSHRPSEENMASTHK